MTMEQLLRSPQFKQALFDVQNEECERLEAELALEPIHVSPAFERRMQRLIRAERRPYYRFANTSGKKAVLALAATFLLLVTMVFSVSAIREPVVRFFVKVYEKFSQVFYHQQEAQFPGILEVYYAPTWLPEGYSEGVDQAIDIITECEQTYTCESKYDIKFTQHTITSMLLRIDTEGVQIESVSVNGREGFYYSNKEIQNLSWSDGQYGFRISGPISQVDLLRVAESIQAVEKKK